MREVRTNLDRGTSIVLHLRILPQYDTRTIPVNHTFVTFVCASRHALQDKLEDVPAIIMFSVLLACGPMPSWFEV